MDKYKLREILLAAGSIKQAALLSESTFFNESEQTRTDVPIINTALSGKLDGGLSSGLLMIAGESKRFKSLLGLIMLKSYMDKYKNSVCLYFDSEFGIKPDYIKSLNIDIDRIIHIPILHIEQLKFDIVKRLDAIEKGNKVFIFIDSIGNLASKKEVDDAESGNSANDMTRAKSLKSLFRIITPHFTMKDIPCVVINHTYKEQTLYPKDIVSGGTGGYYSSNDIWIITRSQEKVGTEVVGWNFTINIEKSRRVQEKSKFTFTVNYESGINMWSGLLDLALESGHVIKPKVGWYQKKGFEDNYREKDTNKADFWIPILTDKTFREFVKDKFTLSNTNLISTEGKEEVEDIFSKLED